MTTTHSNKLAVDDRLEAHRAVIRLSLDELAIEVETALRAARLDFAVYLVAPSSGNSILTMATPLDPADADWAEASTIVCQLVGSKLGGIRLGTRPLRCSVANARFGAADVMPEPTTE